MCPLRLSTILLSLLLLTGCASSSLTPVQRHPDASLLLPCEKPRLPAAGVRLSNVDVGLLITNLGLLLKNCALEKDALINFYKKEVPDAKNRSSKVSQGNR